MAAPITNASDLNNNDIRSQVFKEYINGNPFRWVMGTSPNSIVQLDQDTSKGRGDTITFSLVDAFDTSLVKRGDEQLEGNESDLQYYTDQVTMDYVRYAAKVEQYKLVRARTPVEVVELLRPQIIDAQSQILRDDIIAAAVADYITPGSTGGTPVAAASSPNRSRVLFGNSDSNYHATFSTALGNIDTVNDKLSLDMVKIARKKALNVSQYSNGTSTRKIRPFRVAGQNGAIIETYVMFLDSISAEHLKADSDFTELRDDARSNEISLPFFNGSKYLGKAEGVMFYEIEELNRVSAEDDGGSSSRVAYNMLCGAQAFGVGVAEPGFFAERDIDFKMHVGVGHTIIRGVKRLMFNSVENGVVHVFASGEV